MDSIKVGAMVGSHLTNFTEFYKNYVDSDYNYDINLKIEDLNALYRDSIIQRAVKMICDDVCSMNYYMMKRVWFNTNDENIKKELDNLFVDLNLNELVFRITKKIIMFGNAFLRIYYNEGYRGIVNVELENDITRYIPFEINNSLLFWYDRLTNTKLEPFEVLCFKNLDYNESRYYVDNFKVFDSNNKSVVFKNTFVYGSGLFDSVLRVWKQIKLIEDSFIMLRVERGEKLRIIKVRVPKNATPSQIEQKINKITNAFGRNEIFNVSQPTFRDTKFKSSLNLNLLV